MACPSPQQAPASLHTPALATTDTTHGMPLGMGKWQTADAPAPHVHPSHGVRIEQRRATAATQPLPPPPPRP